MFSGIRKKGIVFSEVQKKMIEMLADRADKELIGFHDQVYSGHTEISDVLTKEKLESVIKKIVKPAIGGYIFFAEADRNRILEYFGITRGEDIPGWMKFTAVLEPGQGVITKDYLSERMSDKDLLPVK